MPPKQITLNLAIEKIKTTRIPIDLDLFSSNIGDVGAELLAESLKLAQGPIALSLGSNNIRENGARCLAQSLKVAQVHINLNLAGNFIGAVGAGAFADAIKVAKVPFVLDLWCNDIGDEGARLFAEAIREAQVPIILGLGNNSIGEYGVGCLAQSLKLARAHINLDLNSNNIGDAGAELLAESLKLAKVPITLGLGSNSIRDAGAGYLARSLGVVEVHVSLSLVGNSIGDAGAAEFAEAIKVAKVPFVLYLWHNAIGEAGIKLLAQSLEVVQVPINLGLWHNNIGEAGVKLFSQSLKLVQVPISLGLGHNNIEKNAVEYLAKGLEELQVPINLTLNSNNIGDAGAELLAASLKLAQAPIALDLSNNNIGEDGARSLAESLKLARVPLRLDLEENFPIEAIAAQIIADAKHDNFIIDAGTNPPEFLERIKVSIIGRMLEQKLRHVSVLAMIVQDYIGCENLAWLEVAAIRAVEGASQDNKYSSINYELLAATYLTQQDDEQKINPLHYDSSTSAHQQVVPNVFNLLLLISRIKALSNRLEIPQGYVDVPGDGLCFYHAVARQLGRHHYVASELQQMAINEIINHLDRYEGFAVQYGGDLTGFLNYHLQRQESEKGGWADNIMIQALANALGHVIEVQLFDRGGNAIGAGPVIINPHHIVNEQVLRLGNIDDLHFVARIDDGLALLNDEEKMLDDDAFAPAVISMNRSVSNSTYHVPMPSDSLSFELTAELSGIDTALSNAD